MSKMTVEQRRLAIATMREGAREVSSLFHPYVTMGFASVGMLLVVFAAATENPDYLASLAFTNGSDQKEILANVATALPPFAAMFGTGLGFVLAEKSLSFSQKYDGALLKAERSKWFNRGFLYSGACGVLGAVTLFSSVKLAQPSLQLASQPVVSMNVDHISCDAPVVVDAVQQMRDAGYQVRCDRN